MIGFSRKAAPARPVSVRLRRFRQRWAWRISQGLESLAWLAARPAPALVPVPVKQHKPQGREH